MIEIHFICISLFQLYDITIVSDKYGLTFQATGCINKEPPKEFVDWWKGQQDQTVFEDMMIYCSQTRSGSASAVRKEVCCGKSNPNCIPDSCALQSQFSEGTSI